jgi:hypothetical protein
MLKKHIDSTNKVLGWEAEQAKTAKSSMKFLFPGGDVTENPQDVERLLVSHIEKLVGNFYIVCHGS